MKNKAEYNTLFDSSGCLTRDAIALYIDKKLTDKELKSINKHVSGCELCASALEGAKYISSSQTYNLHLNQMHGSSWRKSMSKNTRSRKVYYGLSSVAASLILLMGLFFILRIDNYFTKNTPVKNAEMAYVDEEDSAMQLEPKAPVLIQKELEHSLVKKERQTSKDEVEYESINITSKSEVPIVAEVLVEDTELEIISDTDDLMVAQEENLNITSSMAMKSVSKSRIQADKVEEDQVFNSEQISVSKKSSKKRSLLRKDTKSYFVAEVKPIFQGGSIDDFNRFLADSIKMLIPDSILIESIVISFVVDTAGNVDKVKLLSGTSSDVYNQAIIDFVKSSPVWVPANINGAPIEMQQETKVVLDSSKGLQ